MSIVVEEDESGPGVLGTEADVLVPRVIAAAIDTVIVSLVLGSYATVLLSMGFEEAPVFVFSAGVYAVYFAFFETYWSMTPGKWACGIIVVQENGRSATPLAILIRTIFRGIDGLFYYGIGLLVVLGSRKSQRLGDFAAQTVVVRRRGPTHGFATWIHGRFAT